MGTRKSRTVTGQMASRRAEALAPGRARSQASRQSLAELASVSTSVPAAPNLSSAVAQLPVRFVTASHADLVRTAPAARRERAAPRSTGVREHFGELRSALADGWEIVQPIFARPLWNVTDDSTTAFNFVLRRECTTRLLTVPGGRTVERFIREHHLEVDYRR